LNLGDHGLRHFAPHPPAAEPVLGPRSARTRGPGSLPLPADPRVKPGEGEGRGEGLCAGNLYLAE